LTTLGPGAFAFCGSLPTIVPFLEFPLFSDNAFNSCTKFIHRNDFQWCVGHWAISFLGMLAHEPQPSKIPRGELERPRFSACTSLTTINLAAVGWIDDYAFQLLHQPDWCHNPRKPFITSALAFFNPARIYGRQRFCRGFSVLGDRISFNAATWATWFIPATVTYIGMDAFGNCSQPREPEPLPGSVQRTHDERVGRLFWCHETLSCQAAVSSLGGGFIPPPLFPGPQKFFFWGFFKNLGFFFFPKNSW